MTGHLRARKQDALRGRWDLVDLDRGVLTIPLSKSGRPRHIPLSPAAVRVLQLQATRRKPGNPYVFPSRYNEGMPMQGLRWNWERAKRAAAAARAWNLLPAPDESTAA